MPAATDAGIGKTAQIGRAIEPRRLFRRRRRFAELRKRAPAGAATDCALAGNETSRAVP
jgi:hypothetical protein